MALTNAQYALVHELLDEVHDEQLIRLTVEASR